MALSLMPDSPSPCDLLPRGARAAIARELGVQTSVVTTVLQGRYSQATSKGARTVRRVQVAVAKRLRRRVDDVFPKQQSAA